MARRSSWTRWIAVCGARHEVRELCQQVDAKAPANFYLLSYPAHAVYPTQMVKFADLQALALGSMRDLQQAQDLQGDSSRRHQELPAGDGLYAVGVGSNWNTMPAHTHMRRSEVYFYFDVDAGAARLSPDGTAGCDSHIVMKDKEVVVSPGWSIHAGVGTKNYGFCWGMGGENQDYGDMDAVAIEELR